MVFFLNIITSSIIHDLLFLKTVLDNLPFMLLLQLIVSLLLSVVMLLLLCQQHNPRGDCIICVYKMALTERCYN